ncbi:MAG: hypothetical protein B1H04_00370 [Planctomycetales bacterium 4484_123]|nr:MAG: hypothetical protein B1H04_00370 [Planctomycetales bacterium 4484_123]
MKTKFIIAGTGNRGLGCFAKGLTGWEGKSRPGFTDRAELVGLVDANLSRAQACARELKMPQLVLARTVSEAQEQARADWCIVTTPDFTHAKVVVEALEAGLNVVVDKPLATSAWECDQILQAMERTGRQVIVGHNARYHPRALRAAQLVREGAIGQVLHIEAAEVLSYSHGGDYFHRWHSDFSKSAGLLTHKCCHQLDLICWIIDDEPVEVSAWGGRGFYRPRPDLNHGERCSECPIGRDCPHYFDMDKWDGVRRRIYRDCEAEDGYIRDRCVFSDRHTINDHETLNIRFAGGALASFTQVAFAPEEYCYFNFTGTRGRLEMQSREPQLRMGQLGGKMEDVSLRPEPVEGQLPADDYVEHGHGGADVCLIADILGLPGSHPLQRAHPKEARRAVLIADLANRSIAAGGRPVRAEEAGKDYPPAPPPPAD